MGVIGKKENPPAGGVPSSARDDLLFDNLPADAAVRFSAVAGLVRARASRYVDRPRLLDVGGHPCTFARAFTAAYPRWSAITVDTVDDQLDSYKIGSALELPFEDASFDVVTTIDVFEHIPPRHRRLFLGELCRVSRSTVIIAAPFYHEATARIEALLNTTHEKAIGGPHPWLGEHVENGLPKIRETFEALPSEFGIVEAVGNYNLADWFVWQLLDLARKVRGELDAQWDPFDEAQLHGVMRTSVDLPYRTILVAEKGEPARIRPTEILPPPEAADHLVASAKLLTMLVEISSPASMNTGASSENMAVNERLKEALLAAEMEIGRLQRGGGSLAGRVVRKLRRMLKR